MPHTPEPWLILTIYNDDENCDIVHTGGKSSGATGVAYSVGIENAKRIVACVNAMRDVANEDISLCEVVTDAENVTHVITFGTSVEEINEECVTWLQNEGYTVIPPGKKLHSCN